MIRPDPARVAQIMRETRMDYTRALRHEQQRLDLVARFDAARSEAARRFADDWADRLAGPKQAGSIADVIALEHAAGDEAHVTGLDLEHCQKYVRRNAALVAALKGGTP